MAEPIDPKRWKDAASSQWRRRFDSPAPEPELRAAAWAVSESEDPAPRPPVPLAPLLATGAELSDAEIAYVTSEVAVALADLHQSGQCHGAVGVSAVQVGALGQVMLGVTPRGFAGSESIAEDVAGLLALFEELTRARPIAASLAKVRVALARASATATDVNDALRPLAAESLVRLIDQHRLAEPDAHPSDDGIDTYEPKSVVEVDVRAPQLSGEAQRARSSPDASPIGSGVRPTSGGGPARPGLSPPVMRQTLGEVPVDRGAASQLREVVGYLGRPVSLGAGLIAGCLLIWIAIWLPRGSELAVAATASSEPAVVPSASTEATTPPSPSASGSASGSALPVLPGPDSIGDRGAAGASAPVSWMITLVSVDERRLAAFTAGNSDQLKEVDSAGSAAMTNDLTTLAELRQRNVKPIGLQTSVESVRVLTQSAGTVILEVADHRSGYELIDRVTGVTVERVPARGSQRWRVRLDHQDSGWLVTAVTHVPARGRTG